MFKHNIMLCPELLICCPLSLSSNSNNKKHCQHPTPGYNIIMLGKWRSQWQSDPQQALAWESSCFHVWIGISLTGAGWGMWTHRHLLPARVYFNDKNKFLSELWPAQSTVRIAFSAGVYPCSYRDHPSPVSHCLSSQRLLQASLCSWCLKDLVQRCQKENAKAWESTYPSNKWSLFTANSTKACLSL